MLLLIACWCPLLMRHCFLNRWTCPLSFKKPPFSLRMSPLWLKHMYSVLSALTWKPMPAAGSFPNFYQFIFHSWILGIYKGLWHHWSQTGRQGSCRFNTPQMGKILSKKRWPGHDIKLHLMVRFLYRSSGSVDYTFMAKFFQTPFDPEAAILVRVPCKGSQRSVWKLILICRMCENFKKYSLETIKMLIYN